MSDRRRTRTPSFTTHQPNPRPPRWTEADVRALGVTIDVVTAGQTTIKPGESRRIVAQQRLRIEPDGQGNFQFQTIAPSPLFTVLTRGRVSAYALLPFEDEDVRISVVPELTEQGFGYELTRVKQRQIASWFWQNDPILRLGYRYN